MKYLILIAIIYLAYRFVLQPALSPPAEDSRSNPNIRDGQDEDDGDYIDYEEVD